MRPLIGDRIFGCDVCQTVCPHNAKTLARTHPEFAPRAEAGARPELIPLLNIGDAEFRRRFAGSPVTRTKRRGLRRNVAVALGNLGDPHAVPALVRALGDEDDPVVRGHAAWALGRIGTGDAREGLRARLALEQRRRGPRRDRRRARRPGAMSLRGRRILITSGPTRAALDAVRFLTNKATGRLGSLIAEAALEAGAEVAFVYGRGSAIPAVRGGRADRLRLLPIDTVEDLIVIFEHELRRGYDAVIHAMAVLDFAPAQVRPEKTSSSLDDWVIHLVPTPKAAMLVRQLAPSTFFIGFKLEVGKPRADLVDIAADWARRNGADLVVANDMRDIERGTHIGYLVNAAGAVEQIAEGKETIARALVERLIGRLGAPP